MVKEADTVIRYFHQHEVRLSEALDDFEWQRGVMLILLQLFGNNELQDDTWAK